MKKMFFYAAVACVAFASCSKDNGVEVPSYNVENEDAPQAIQFKMRSNIEVTTRGTGTGAVGDLNNSAENVWAGEKLNVYMFNKGHMTLAVDGQGAEYFNNTEVIAPSVATDTLANYGTAKYYGPNKDDNYDFFAYHAVGAIESAPAQTIVGTDTTYTATVVIDGTNDIMVAKAMLGEVEEAKIAAWDVKNPTKLFDRGRVYSAYSARRGVQPRFAFEHELSRFVFHAQAMEEGATGTNGIKINKVEIVDAQTTGKLTVASKNNDLGVIFDGTTKATLTLQDRNDAYETSNMSSVSLTGQGTGEAFVGDTLRLGESMLLNPNVAEYQAKVYYSQTKADGTTIDAVYDPIIKLESGDNFEKGTQYNVYIKVYDFKAIELVVDLVGWKEGEDVNLDSEE